MTWLEWLINDALNKHVLSPGLNMDMNLAKLLKGSINLVILSH